LVGFLNHRAERQRQSGSGDLRDRIRIFLAGGERGTARGKVCACAKATAAERARDHCADPAELGRCLEAGHPGNLATQ
jgi:hypothetical protein